MDSHNENQEENGYYLLIGSEGIVRIEVTPPTTSGGCQHADGSLFKKGEKVYLEQLNGISGLEGVSITALNESGEIIYAFSVPEGASNEDITPDTPLITGVVFYGDMTTYGISFTDASGNERHFAVYISGRNGALMLEEYLP